MMMMMMHTAALPSSSTHEHWKWHKLRSTTTASTTTATSRVDDDYSTASFALLSATRLVDYLRTTAVVSADNEQITSVLGTLTVGPQYGATEY